ncbi:cellulose synthase family protein [Striga asiatica]|uniref:Cellulose synthase family protein n=1 Tax=Striga asiatica TaxID=4170 RepID=A0A5A7QF67_STRAF|nr:cellulose synthase family protein [Striga asiatica]
MNFPTDVFLSDKSKFSRPTICRPSFSTSILLSKFPKFLPPARETPAANLQWKKTISQAETGDRSTNYQRGESDPSDQDQPLYLAEADLLGKADRRRSRADQSRLRRAYKVSECTLEQAAFQHRALAEEPPGPSYPGQIHLSIGAYIACAGLLTLVYGRTIHEQILKHGKCSHGFAVKMRFELDPRPANRAYFSG